MRGIEFFNDVNLRLKAQKIKLVAFDVDGVMTDGSLTFLEDGREIKTYNSKDGQGVVMLNKAGFKTAIITARDNGTVVHRAEVLGITKLFKGQKNKVKALDELCAEFNVQYDEVAYMGDDFPDLCVIERVGLSCAPKDAIDEVKNAASIISNYGGGRGAVREFCNFILKANNITWNDIVKNNETLKQ